MVQVWMISDKLLSRYGLNTVGLDNEKRIFSKKMRKERKKRERGEKIG